MPVAGGDRRWRRKTQARSPARTCLIQGQTSLIVLPDMGKGQAFVPQTEGAVDQGAELPVFFFGKRRGQIPVPRWPPVTDALCPVFQAWRMGRSVHSSSAMPAALLFLLAAAVGGTVQVAHAVEEVPQPCLYPHDALQSRGGMRAAGPSSAAVRTPRTDRGRRRARSFRCRMTQTRRRRPATPTPRSLRWMRPTGMRSWTIRSTCQSLDLPAHALRGAVLYVRTCAKA